MLRIAKSGFIVFSFILIAGCGKSERAGIPVSTDLIGTEWIGTYKERVGRTAFGDPSRIRMQLSENSQFEISSPKDIAAFVRGSFMELEKNKSLSFEVEESNFDLFGEGSVYDYNYNLDGEELMMDGDAGRYLLKKANSENSEGSEEGVKFFSHDWTCSEGGYKIFVNISEDSFRGRKEANGGGSKVFFEGDALHRAGDDVKNGNVLLTIKESSAEDFVGTRLLMKHANNNADAVLMQLRETGDSDSGNSVGSITCKR